MNIAMLPLFLVGRRDAILRFAQSRWTLLVGLLLVISGGLARYYDGAYLAEEWTSLLRGVVVATGNAFVLFTLVYVIARARKQPLPRFWSGYLTFLGLFWMTAPMAWLYAVPYERFLSPIEAVNANQWTLGVVSLWRVILITRVLAVIFGARAWRIFFLVMLFSDAAMLLAAKMMKTPVLDVMGGLQQTEVERAVASSTFGLIILTVITAPVWIIGSMVACARLTTEWSVPESVRRPVPALALVIAFLLIAAWIPALLKAQPEQRLRWEAEALMNARSYDAGLAALSQHTRAEYPPVWDPPPRIGYNEHRGQMPAIRAALANNEYAPWVEAMYLEKSWRAIPGHWSGPFTPEALEGGMQPDLDAEGLEFHADHDPRLTDRQRERFREVAAEVRRFNTKGP
jgi:hypothetical protein